MKLILAVGTFQEIGFGPDKKYELPWKQKADLMNFKKLTSGHICIMGYNTFLSFQKSKDKSEFKTPLKNRINIVLDSNKNIDIQNDDLITCRTLSEAIMLSKQKYPEKDIFVIGGKYLFESILLDEDGKYLDKITDVYYTKIHSQYKNYVDVLDMVKFDSFYIPHILQENFTEAYRQYNAADEDNQFDYTFFHYIKN